jgi:hypothetical protein
VIIGFHRAFGVSVDISSKFFAVGDPFDDFAFVYDLSRYDVTNLRCNNDCGYGVAVGEKYMVATGPVHSSLFERSLDSWTRAGSLHQDDCRSSTAASVEGNLIAVGNCKERKVYVYKVTNATP